MFPLFHLAKNTGNAVIGCLICLFCLLLVPLVQLATYAWVDMPYILLATIAILFLVKYVQSNKYETKIICIGAFFTAIAIITCLYGIALLITGLIIIAIKNRSRIKKALLHIILFGFISFLPEFLWMYRNITLISKPTAGGYPVETEPITNVLQLAFWIFKKPAATGMDSVVS